MIAAGRVSVAGRTVNDPAFDVAPGCGEVAIDGEPVSPEAVEVWMLNKPRGAVSTARDPQGRRTVVDLVSSRARLYPVGRLDAESEGLILLTNHGSLANRLTHPRYEVAKTYLATLAAPPSDDVLHSLAAGVELDDGPTAPAEVRRAGRAAIEIVLREGRNRQVRRMAEAVGHRVVRLRRLRIGSLELGELPAGEARRLGEDEIASLWEDAGGEPERDDIATARG